MVKKNGYQEIIIRITLRKNTIYKKSLRELLTINHSLSQPQQQTEATDIQEEEIRMSINLSYIEGSSEKLQGILRPHKIRSTFYTTLNALCVNSFENLKVK